MDLFNYLFEETKGFQYQITLKVKLKEYKYKNNKLIEIELTPFYFNSTTKIVINHKFGLNKSFQEILYRTSNWTNERIWLDW